MSMEAILDCPLSLGCMRMCSGDNSAPASEWTLRALIRAAQGCEQSAALVAPLCPSFKRLESGGSR